MLRNPTGDPVSFAVEALNKHYRGAREASYSAIATKTCILQHIFGGRVASD